MEVPYWMSRTNLLLGEEKIEKLINSHVLVVGLGGVGGICAEMIARSGVGKMTIVDADVVEASNCNRQIPALSTTGGQLKATVMGQRLKDINPNLDLTILPEYLQGDRTNEILKEGKFDYAVDCIDTLSPKVFFIKACMDMGIPIVSSLGAGGKVNPSLVQIADISETSICRLARYVRKRLRNQGIREGLKVVFSTEDIDRDKIVPTPDDMKKKSVIGTISYMPAIFGCTVASVVIRELYQQN